MRSRIAARPPDTWSSVTTWLATFHGRRHGSGVSIVPNRIRSVLAATAHSSPHGSTPYAASQTKTPSHPACSASTACSNCSPAVPPGKMNPYLIHQF